MNRLIVLAAVLVGLGCSSTQAGLIVQMDDAQPTAAVNVTVDLTEMLPVEQPAPPSVEEHHSKSGLAGTSMSVAGGFPAFAVSAFGRTTLLLASVGNTTLMNSLLPPPPDLSGLIKPPRA